MATNRTSEHLRYRYGICLNDNCSKCKNKEVQQVSARKEFVCEECGKPLRECPPTKSGLNKMVLAAIAAVVVIAAGIGIFWGFSGGDTPEVAPADSLNIQTDSLIQPIAADTVAVVKTDTVAVKEQVPAQVKNTPKQSSQPAAKSSGAFSLSYGKYSGGTQAGKPHGQGRMTYTTSHVIDPRDSKRRVAEAGDYIIGEWNNGNLVQGRWYGSDGNVKGAIIIGM